MRPKILEMNGLSMQDFWDQGEAFDCAHDLVAQAADEYGFQQDTVDHTNPLLVKFYYVLGEGSRRTVTNGTSKRLCAETAPAVKLGRGTLLDMQEITGGKSSLDAESVTAVKDEHPEFAQMKAAAEVLKSFVFSCDVD